MMTSPLNWADLKAFALSKLTPVLAAGALFSGTAAAQEG